MGADCQLATFSYLIGFTAGRMARAWEHIMVKEEVSMFMSENICALVDLFDKAFAEGRGRDKHCENEVVTLWRDIGYVHTVPPSETERRRKCIG